MTTMVRNRMLPLSLRREGIQRSRRLVDRQRGREGAVECVAAAARPHVREVLRLARGDLGETLLERAGLHPADRTEVHAEHLLCESLRQLEVRCTSRILPHW